MKNLNSSTTKSLFFLLALLLLALPGILFKRFSQDLCKEGFGQPEYFVLDSLDPPGKPCGFFVGFSMVIGFLDYCEQHENAGFYVNFPRGMYFDRLIGPNWWEYYFEPIRTGSRVGARTLRFSDEVKSDWFAYALFDMDKARAQAIIEKYIKVKPHIQTKIDSFVNQHFKDRFVIGVHYRGTDKSSEAPRVPYETVFKEVQEIISGLDSTPYTIFVATDEQGFIDQISSLFKNVAYQDVQHSSNGKPLHHNEGEQVSNPAQQGEEALRDCLLLSKCNVLVRTASNLNIAANCFNSQIELREISQRYDTVLKTP